ncbi:unnamed protein product [Linum trigynum]|uniref:Uncharacterized protein n=1 Tax=Linum trigynum TaxID=586398 RepID=A0AAV2CQR2_9ROSI
MPPPLSCSYLQCHLPFAHLLVPRRSHRRRETLPVEPSIAPATLASRDTRRRSAAVCQSPSPVVAARRLQPPSRVSPVISLRRESSPAVLFFIGKPNFGGCEL